MAAKLLKILKEMDEKETVDVTSFSKDLIESGKYKESQQDVFHL